MKMQWKAEHLVVTVPTLHFYTFLCPHWAQIGQDLVPGHAQMKMEWVRLMGGEWQRSRHQDSYIRICTCLESLSLITLPLYLWILMLRNSQKYDNKRIWRVCLFFWEAKATKKYSSFYHKLCRQYSLIINSKFSLSMMKFRFGLGCSVRPPLFRLTEYTAAFLSGGRKGTAVLTVWLFSKSNGMGVGGKLF